MFTLKIKQGPVAGYMWTIHYDLSHILIECKIPVMYDASKEKSCACYAHAHACIYHNVSTGLMYHINQGGINNVFK